MARQKTSTTEFSIFFWKKNFDKNLWTNNSWTFFNNITTLSQYFRKNRLWKILLIVWTLSKFWITQATGNQNPILNELLSLRFHILQKQHFERVVSQFSQDCTCFPRRSLLHSIRLENESLWHYHKVAVPRKNNDFFKSLKAGRDSY